jgi:hypothetical protein
MEQLKNSAARVFIFLWNYAVITNKLTPSTAALAHTVCVYYIKIHSSGITPLSAVYQKQPETCEIKMQN